METATNYSTDEDIPCREYTLVYAKSPHICIVRMQYADSVCLILCSNIICFSIILAFGRTNLAIGLQ